jgi:hypothetical protein
MADASKVTFLYSKSSDYKLVPATGIYGGPTATGHIRVEFFVDHPTDPDKTVHAVTPEGRIGEELEREPRDRSITREFQMGLILAPEVADSIGRWLQDKVALVRGATEKTNA